MALNETPSLEELRGECKLRLFDLEQPPKFLESVYNAEINRQLDLWTQTISTLQVTYLTDILAGVNPTIITPLPGYQLGPVEHLAIRQNNMTILNLEVRSPEQMYAQFVNWPDPNTDAGTPLYAVFDFDPNTNGNVLHNAITLWPGPSQSWTQGGSIASGTITVGGTANTGDVVTATVGAHTASYTVVGGDTTSTIATGLTTALNAVSAFATDYTASATGAVVTIVADAIGSDFNVSLSVAVTGTGATTTATVSGATLTSGSNAGGGLVITCKATTDGLLQNDGDCLPLLARLAKEPIISGTCATLLARTGNALATYHDGEGRRESARIRRAAGLERRAPSHTRTYNT